MPPRESKSQRAARAKRVFAVLEATYPNAAIELRFDTELELLVAVILSAQCTDKRVNLVTPALFTRFKSAADYARVAPEVLHPFIQSCGLYRAKARNIVAMARELVSQHGGLVPRTRAELGSLPGVGSKTAGVVTSHLPGGERAFPVDTHVGRLARRLAFSLENKPDRVELDLQPLVPRERWALAHQLLIFHGRRCCFARTPSCAACPIATMCPKVGVRAPPRAQPSLPRRPGRAGSPSRSVLGRRPRA